MEHGGKVIFFSRGGKYEEMARNINCKIVKLKPFWKNISDKVKKTIKNKNVPIEKWYKKVYSRELIEDLVKEEIDIFKKTGIEMIVTSQWFSINISARFLKIPTIVLVSGTLMPPYIKSGYATFPENYENLLTKILPKFIKKKITKWYLLHNKMFVKITNKVSKKYKIKQFKDLTDIFLGDYTFVCDDINFLGVKPTEDFPLENYIGPIFSKGVFNEEFEELDADIKNHLKKSGKSILLMMGSIGHKKNFLNILEALNKTNHNVIAVYTTIVKKEELPETNENILLKQFLSQPLKVNKMVDLAIIHGGRGTVYTAAYSGKPVIGIPEFIEHQYNIDNLVRNGAAIRISKKFFQPEMLIHAIVLILSVFSERHRSFHIVNQMIRSSQISY